MLARGVTGFLARNQEYELAALQVTGEDGREVLGRMLTAQKELRAAVMEGAAKKRMRDALERTLRRKMRHVVVILGVTIRAQDGRWLAFGLNRPARSAGVRRPILSTSEPGEMIALPQSPERAAEVLPEATAA